MAEPVTVTSSYVPGDGVAIATPEVWLLVDAPSNDPLVTEMWSRLQGSEERGTNVAEKLSATQWAFALVADFEGAPTLVLGGGAEAEVEVTGTSQSFRCPPVLRRVDHHFRHRPSSISLCCRPREASASALLPLGAGIASASRLVLTLSHDGVARQTEDIADTDVTAAGTAPSPTTPEPSDSERAPVAEAADRREPTSPQAVASRDPVSADPPDRPAKPVEAPEVNGADEDPGYGFLFGNTVNRSVADAAVESHGEEEEEPSPTPAAPAQDPLRGADTLLGVPAEPEPAPVTPEPAPAEATPGPAELAVAATTPKTSGMIESVPWAVAEEPAPVLAAAPGASAAPVADDREELDHTMSRAAADALARQVAAGSDPAPPGPTVHAVHCGAGHANPPQADVCRVCGSPVAPQAPVTVPRPVLGHLRFSTGDVIPLDRNVLIGRQPGAERLVDGSRPHVVKVPSPEKDISRNHLEIRLDDWHVLATDLNSTNGTILTRPGRPPERLRPDEATMIEPGTRVSLADDVSFAFEAT